MRYSRLSKPASSVLMLIALLDLIMVIFACSWMSVSVLFCCIYLYLRAMSWVNVSDDRQFLIHRKYNWYLRKKEYRFEQIPQKIKNILFLERDFTIRAFATKTGGLYYKDSRDYHLYYFFEDKTMSRIEIFATSDEYILYKGARFLALELNKPLIENDLHNTRLLDDDNHYFEKTNHERSYNINNTINYFTGKIKP